jgi:hypothetical protein
MPHLSTEHPDDIDRLFARLERAPVPEDLTRRVLAQTVARSSQRAVFAWPWLVAGLAAMAILTVAGYLLGANLAASDGLDVLEALLGDLSLIATAPGDVLAALGEVMPWRLLALAGVSAALMIWATGRLVAPLRQAA